MYKKLGNEMASEKNFYLSWINISVILKETKKKEENCLPLPVATCFMWEAPE